MFNDIIVRHFSNPTFASVLDDATTIIELGNPVCGDRIKVQLKIVNNHIQKVGYQAWGCAASIATANVFCEFINDQQLSFVRASKEEAIDSLLGDLEPSQYHCLEMLRSLFRRMTDVS